jgi:histone deacetylase 1/2
MSNPAPAHWQTLKHLLRYLRGTQDLGLCYNFGKQPSAVAGLHGFTDASYADCPDTGKSTVGYAFFYGPAILSWFSKLHTFVTTCTNHSEYAALAAGAKEAQWMVFLFSELESQTKHTPVPMFVDNSGVISMVFNPVDHQSNKHIRIACHYARELADEKVIAPQRVATDKNLADIFTKPLGGVAFKALVGNYVSGNGSGCGSSSGNADANPGSSVRGGVLARSQLPPSGVEFSSGRL